MPQMILPTDGLTLRLECFGRSNFVLDANDKVQTWINPASYGNFEQPTDTKRPEYFDDIQGSGPILRFGDAGASHWLQNLNPVSGLMNTNETAGNGTEVFIIARPIAYGTTYASTGHLLTGSSALVGLECAMYGASPPYCVALISCGGGSSWQTGQLFNHQRDKMAYMHGRWQYTANQQGKALGRNIFDQAQYKETALATQSNTPPYASATARIGTINGAETYKLQAYIKCILVYNRILTRDERAQVDEYLLATYPAKPQAYFIDYVNGSDANEGLKMSAAKKTMAGAWGSRLDTGKTITFIRRGSTELLTANNTPTKFGLPSSWHTYACWPRPAIAGLQGNFTNGSILVTGVTGTTLSALSHEARRVVAPDGRTYLVGRVLTSNSFNLHNLYTGASTNSAFTIKEDYDYDYANSLTAFEGADQKTSWNSDTLDIPTITTAGLFYAYYGTLFNMLKHLNFLNGNGALGSVYFNGPGKIYGCILNNPTVNKPPMLLGLSEQLQDCVVKSAVYSNVLYSYTYGEIRLTRCAFYSTFVGLASVGYFQSSVSMFRQSPFAEDCGIGLDGEQPTNLFTLSLGTNVIANFLYSFVNCGIRYGTALSTISEITTGNSSARFIFQNYGNVDGWTLVTQPKFGTFQTNFGDANITLPANNTWVLEVLANQQSALNSPIRDRFNYESEFETTFANPLLEWRAPLKNKSTTVKVFVNAEETITNCNIWLEALYYKNGNLIVKKSTEKISTRASVSDWSKYLSVFIDSDSSIPVSIRLYSTHYTENDKKFYVNPLIQEIGMRAVFAGSDAFAQGYATTVPTADKILIGSSAGLEGAEVVGMFDEATRNSGLTAGILKAGETATQQGNVITGSFSGTEIFRRRLRGKGMLIRTGSNANLVFLMIDAVTGLGKTGLNPTVFLSKNGGDFYAGPGATPMNHGYYRVQLRSSDSDTEGLLVLYATAPGAIPVDDFFEVSSFRSETSINLSQVRSSTDAIKGLVQNNSPKVNISLS